MQNIVPLGGRHSAADTPPPRWLPDLAPGTIVAYAYPAPGLREAGSRRAPHPCLVVDHERLGDQPVLLLAYGVPGASGSARSIDLLASSRDLDAVRGVSGAHVFHIACRTMVMPSSSGFVEDPDHGSPVLGHLRGDALERLHAVRARIHAERDIAAEHRRRRQRRRREGAVRGEDFTVEHRRLPRRCGDWRHPDIRLGGEGGR